MEINEIIEELKYFKGYFPKEALEQAIEKKEEIIPELINQIEWAIENIKVLEEENHHFGYLYAFFLLAQFREKRAFPLIVRFFTILEGDGYYFTGDIITENLDEILTSVYDGNLDMLKKVIENKTINEFIRSAFMDCLMILYKFEEIKRDELITYFRSLFNEKLEREYSYIWQNLVSNCAEIFAEDLIDEINQAYEKDLIDQFELPQEEIIEAIKTKYYQYSHFGEMEKIDDTIKETEWWACFKNDNEELVEPPKVEEKFTTNTNKIISDGTIPYKKETKKIGRNEPCPCGSGKKYKKCCGKIITEKTEDKKMAGIYHIKATLSDYSLKVRGYPYRVIAIDGNDSLYKLAETILDSFDFDMDHCFGFFDNLKNFYQSREGYELFADIGESVKFPGVKETNVKDVYNEINKKMLFFYDYGDSWRFITQLIAVQESKSKSKKPQIVKSVGIAPEQYPEWDDEE